MKKVKGKKVIAKQIKTCDENAIGETIDEEGEQFDMDSGFVSTQGESIYEELDNPEKYEDMSDFDEPHFSE